MSHKPDEDVPGVERITTVDKLGDLDIGRYIELVYDEGRTVGAARAKRRRYFLKKILEEPHFKGMMPQPPQYILHLNWATSNDLNAGKWDLIGPIDGSRKVAVGPVYVRNPSRRPAIPRPGQDAPRAPKRTADRPANLAYRTESKPAPRF